MCEFVYAHLLDLTIAQTTAERGALIARGVSEDLPTVHDAVDALDAALAEVPRRPAPQDDLRKALGLR